MASKIPQPKKEWEVVICWAVCYTRRLVRSPFSKDPLVGNLYAGQTVRPCSKQYPTAQKLAECRWNEEDLGSKHGNGSDLSFLEVLRIYGPEAFDSKIVWQTQGPRWQVQTLANDNDIALILDNGGVLRDIDPYVHIDQTFNRQKGGKSLHLYEGMSVALSAKRWKTFTDEMTKHVGRCGVQYGAYCAEICKQHRLSSWL